MSATSGREKLILLPDKVIATLETLETRIRERFGNCGLADVCAELCLIAREDTLRAISIARGYVWLRVLVFVILAAGVATLAWVVSVIDLTKTAAPTASDSVYSILEGIEAAANLTLLTGAVILFLVKLEERLKRRNALAALHELRSIVHVIDMHQLTKDPSKFIVGGNTPSSPPLELNEFQMTRYLDYCSEMVSLTSKVAVLFGQSLEDQAVAEVVSDIERVGSGLSQKIWQKITMLQDLRTAPDAATASDSDSIATQPS
ncbi:MAG TPA: hypothetical protein VIY51_03100 [Xanthobacteraceae bacterium]